MKDITIIIPTLNEKNNIRLVYDRITEVLQDSLKWEIVFVDDNSKDGTYNEIQKIIDIDSRVRGILRVDRRGLSSAVIDGFLSSSSEYFLVMDGDLQHDHTKISLMYKTIKNNDLDIVIASRFMLKKNNSELEFRFKLSNLVIKFFYKFLNIDLNDPLSGFFIIKKNLILEYHKFFSGISFKILLDIILTIGFRNLKIKELPSDLNDRFNEESKLDIRNIIDFIFLLIDKVFGKIIPLRFIKFSIVGFTGIFVQIFSAYILMRFFLINFNFANPLSIVIATASNFYFNNYFTYSDKKLSGIILIIGMIKFQIFCFFGSIINYYVSNSLYSDFNNWPIAIIIGSITGAVLNYAINNQFTWRKFSR